MGRTLVWFSCGAASAVAAKLTAEAGACEILYTDPGAEHADNRRFLHDCEKWIGQGVKILKSDKYADIWEVFEKTRYLVGPYGARCTTEMKKNVREAYQRYGDTHVFGFTADEELRHLRFGAQNRGISYRSPLLALGMTKLDCFGVLEKAGIARPAIYDLGFPNANCVGCVKGQQAYWNRVRRHFPDVFLRMSKMERKLNIAINKSYAGDGKRKRIFLDELDPESGRGLPEPSISCGAVCEVDISQYDEAQFSLEDF